MSIPTTVNLPVTLSGGVAFTGSTTAPITIELEGDSAHDIGLKLEGGTIPVALNLEVTGNSTQPISLLAIGESTQPISLLAIGDSTQPISLLAIGNSTQPISLLAIGDSTQPISLLAIGDSTQPISLLAIGDTAHPISLDINLHPVKIDLGLDNINVCLSLAVTEFPRMRVHLPTKYDFGLSLFGLPVVNFSVCGESSLITEDNPPRVFQAVQPDPEPPDTPDAASDLSSEAPFRVTLS